MKVERLEEENRRLQADYRRVAESADSLCQLSQIRDEKKALEKELEVAKSLHRVAVKERDCYNVLAQRAGAGKLQEQVENLRKVVEDLTKQNSSLLRAIRDIREECDDQRESIDEVLAKWGCARRWILGGTF